MVSSTHPKLAPENRVPVGLTVAGRTPCRSQSVRPGRSERNHGGEGEGLGRRPRSHGPRSAGRPRREARRGHQGPTAARHRCPPKDRHISLQLIRQFSTTPKSALSARINQRTNCNHTGPNNQVPTRPNTSDGTPVPFHRDPARSNEETIFCAGKVTIPSKHLR